MTVCTCTVLFRCVLVYWCGSAGVGWYPSAGWCSGGLCVREIEFCQEYKYLGVIFDTIRTDDK